MRSAHISELMIPLDKYPHIHHSCTLWDAIEKFQQTALETLGRKSLARALLVFDDLEVLVGLVRRRDILRGLEPTFLQLQPLKARKSMFDVQMDPNLLEMTFDRVVKGLLVHATNPVTDVMQPIHTTIQYSDHVFKAAYELVSNNLSLLPVLKDGKVVGVVRTVDILHEFGEIIREAKVPHSACDCLKE